MRVHFVLNQGAPESKLADVEIHFDDPGLLFGFKLVGCSVWRTRKGEAPSVLVPARSYATAGGVRYYDLLRASDSLEDEKAQKARMKQFKDYIRAEYLKIDRVGAQTTGPVSCDTK